MSISDRIAKRMGGRITLQSKPGAGSTFEVSIPLPAHESAPERKRFVAPDLAGQSDHARGASNHRDIAARPAPGAMGGRDLHDIGPRSCSRAASGASVARRACRSCDGRGGCLAARSGCRQHAARRIVMVTPSTRQELQATGAAAFTGYLVKPLRTASIAARLSAPAEDLTVLRTTNSQPDCDRLRKTRDIDHDFRTKPFNSRRGGQ